MNLERDGEGTLIVDCWIQGCLYVCVCVFMSVSLFVCLTEFLTRVFCLFTVLDH